MDYNNYNYLSSLSDNKALGHDDYVFFSLEVGEEPKKTKSRFGSNFYKIDYNHLALKYSSMVLVDQYLQEAPKDCRISNLSEKGKKILDENRRHFSEDIMYQGQDLSIISLGCAIIKKARLLPKEDQNLILNSKTDDEINNIINGFYRPEIRVPGMVGIKRNNFIKFLGTQIKSPHLK